MGIFSRSWEVTKLTFSIMKKEKELFIFPILSFIFSLLFIVSILFPSIIIFFIRGESVIWGGIEYLLVFLTYLGLVFIATFFNVCVVYTSANYFGKQEARFWKTIKFALSRIHVILLWSIVAATVGLILNILEEIARKTKGVGKIVILITTNLLGMAWAIVTIFVVPGLVYKNLGPFAAIKQSASVLRKTWGESLVKFFGMGIVSFLFIILGFVIGIPILFLVSTLGIIWILIVIGLGFIYMLSVVLIFSVANKIFDTALYVYAETGVVHGPYNKEIMKNAFKAIPK